MEQQENGGGEKTAHDLKQRRGESSVMALDCVAATGAYWSPTADRSSRAQLSVQIQRRKKKQQLKLQIYIFWNLVQTLARNKSWDQRW